MRPLVTESGGEYLSRRWRAPVAAALFVLAVAGAVHVSHLRAGHDWGDDFAMYIMEARNITQGKPLDATGYIYNTRSS